MVNRCIQRKKREKRWKLRVIAMTSVAKCGPWWSRICLDNAANGKESPRITDVLSMQYLGYCAPERLA